jgi:penicillin-binding protein 1C
MPDNHDFPEINPDDQDEELTEKRPRPVSNESTEDIDLEAIRATDDPRSDENYDPEEDIPFHLPKMNDSDADQPTFNPRHDPHGMQTMPHFREPGVPDPRETLPGTGGLDPNPDMQPFVDVSHSERTVMNLPRASEYDEQQTMQNPNLADARYQRPSQQQSAQSAQGYYVPSPPRQQQPPQQQPLARRRMRRNKIFGLPAGCVYMFLGLMVTFCGGLTLFTLGAAAIFIPRIEAEWGAQVAQVDNYRAFESTFYYDRYGNSLYESFNEGRRDTVNYNRFPAYLINATVAIEDDTFWSNIGVDIPATMVATLSYLGAGSGERVAGGSTITQQVVRNILFDFEYRNEVSASRKAEEIILAFFLTQSRSKDDILTLYLNEIYYGNLAYGAQAASQTFFGKNVEDLTLGEAALLAGLPQAPSNLNPLNPDPEIQSRVYDRWRLVLDEMFEEDYITQAEHDTALRQGLNFVQPDLNNLRAPHFTVYAQNEFADLMIELGYSPGDISSGGYRIYTTIDQNINNIALGAARTQVASLQSRNISNAAVVVIHPITGQIIAMVGSVDYNNDAIDGRVNVTIALRQPGSTMKPFTYASGMELGMTPADVIWDTPVEIGIPGQPTYTPVNYDRAFHGPMGMRMALANSYNIPAVQTLRLVGVDYLLNTMRRVGISTLSNDASLYGVSLTLGGGEVSLLEFANAYGVFANLGSYVPPTSILCIIDSNDNIVYQYENGCPQGSGNFTSNTVDRRGFGTQVMDPRVAFIITDILSDNEARTSAMGSRSSLYTPNIGTAVKTGTTNDIKDNWTVGYTRNVVIGVWVGNNNGDPMVNSSGLTGAAPIWNSVMTSIYTDPNAINVFQTDGRLLPDLPNPPQGISLRQICNIRAVREGATGCPGTVNEWFLDSPAGISDGNGNLIYPQQPLLRSSQADYMQEISPDIYSVLAYPLNPAVAASLQFQLQPGDLTPPAPRFCRVPPQLQQQALAAGAQEMTFIAGPSTSHNDTVRAETWAQQNNYAFLPTVECWDGAFVGGGGWGASIVTAVITSPGNGQSLNNPISIIGTIQFDSSQADFWHLDIIGGQFADWTPMGTQGLNSVVNGELFTGILPPGSYRVRLRLIKDGNFLQQPYEVSFTVQG